MNFDQLNHLWEGSLGEKFQTRLPWIRAVNPVSRLWFVACWNTLVRDGNTRRPDPKLLEQGEEVLTKVSCHLDPHSRRIARLHLDCLRIMGERPYATKPWTAGLEGLCDKDGRVPLGLVLDLEHELRHTPGKAAGEQPATVNWTTTGSLLCGRLRPASHSVTVPVLFVNGGTDQGEIGRAHV